MRDGVQLLLPFDEEVSSFVSSVKKDRSPVVVRLEPGFIPVLKKKFNGPSDAARYAANIRWGSRGSKAKIADDPVMTQIADIWIAGYMDEVRSAVRVLTTDDSYWPKDDHSTRLGDPGGVLEKTKHLLTKIASDGEIPAEPMYRGLHWLQFMRFPDGIIQPGYTFTESLASWTGDRSVASDFAAGKYSPLDVEKSVLMRVTNAPMLPLARYSSSTSDLIVDTDEQITSGTYRVKEVRQTGEASWEVDVEWLRLPYDVDAIQGVSWNGNEGYDSIVRKEMNEYESMARRFALIIEPAVAEDSPTLKSVTVRFNAGLVPVLKHGSHNQLTHGNRSKGGIDRGDMPQIPKTHRERFLGQLEAEGVRHRDENVDPRSLKRTQRAINPKNVQGLYQAMRSGAYRDDGHRIIVSSDDKVLDGHHRWAAAAQFAEETPGFTIGVTRVDMPMSELLSRARRFNQEEGVSARTMEDIAPRTPVAAAIDSETLWVDILKRQVAASSSEVGKSLTIPVTKGYASRFGSRSEAARFAANERWGHRTMSPGLATRAPTKGRATKNPVDGPNGTDWASLPPEVQDDMRARLLEAFPDLGRDGADPIDVISDNVVGAFDAAPDFMQAYGQRWYAQAHNDAEEMARDSGLSVEQSAGVIAALSPKTGWEPNVRWAHWMASKVSEDAPIDVDALSRTVTKSEQSDTVSGWLAREGITIRPGTRLSELSLTDQARYLQVAGQVDGDKVGFGPRLTSSGGVTERDYGNGPPLLSGMKQALTIMRAAPGEEMTAITESLNGHKTRSFYNNIVSQGRDDSITIDVHALDAAVLGFRATVRGGKAKDVYGLDPAVVLDGGKTYPDHGASGVYALFHEGFRRATERVNAGRAERGLDPLTAPQVQAIAWIATLPANRQDVESAA